MRSPLRGSGQRAMSPAAQMPGALVSQIVVDDTPRSTASPACSASSSARPHADARPPPDRPASVAPSSSVDAASRRSRPALCAEVEDARRAPRAARARSRPSSGPSTRSSGRASGATTCTSSPRARSDGGHLEADEARADDHRALRLPRARAMMAAAVGERAQVVHVRQLRARDRQPDRLGAGGEQQRAVARAARRPRASPARAARSMRRDRRRRASSSMSLLGVEARRRAAGSTPRARCRRDSP